MTLKRKMSAAARARIMRIYSLYGELGSLQAVGATLGITRERVRQILRKGQAEGFFRYTPKLERRREDLIQRYERQALIDEISKLETRSALCRRLHITTKQFRHLLRHFHLDFEAYHLIARKRRCLTHYMDIVDVLGYHPSTTKLAQQSNWRSTWSQIIRCWGSAKRFRSEFNIDLPKREWSEKAKLVRTQLFKAQTERKNSNKQKILRLLSSYAALNTRELSNALRMPLPTVFGYLGELMRESHIERVGSRNHPQYRLSAKREG